MLKYYFPKKEVCNFGTERIKKTLPVISGYKRDTKRIHTNMEKQFLISFIKSDRSVFPMKPKVANFLSVAENLSVFMVNRYLELDHMMPLAKQKMHLITVATYKLFLSFLWYRREQSSIKCGHTNTNTHTLFPFLTHPFFPFYIYCNCVVSSHLCPDLCERPSTFPSILSPLTSSQLKFD